MDEILYELREHSLGLNAGRWDYIFSMIKCFRDRPEFVLPDRNDVKMTVPFMRAYSELLVKTCHARGAFAMGGMAALIPSRKDAEANERAIAAVHEDKRREAERGLRRHLGRAPGRRAGGAEEFDAVLGRSPNQIDRQRDDVVGRAPPTCSTRARRPATSPRRACAATSTSASSTSRSGSAAAARPGSTT